MHLDHRYINGLYRIPYGNRCMSVSPCIKDDTGIFPVGFLQCIDNFTFNITLETGYPDARKDRFQGFKVIFEFFIAVY